MVIGNIAQVLNRINEIETKFNASEKKDDKLFAGLLKKEVQAQNTDLKVESKQTSDIKAILQQTAQKYGVDPTLVDNLAKVESSYQADAVSSAGAIGVMQLMPDTAQELGVNNPYDPRENIEGGVKYLKNLLAKYNNTEQAVAAYNAGMGAVDKYGGVPPYAETREYVAKVLKTSE